MLQRQSGLAKVPPLSCNMLKAKQSNVQSGDDENEAAFESLREHTSFLNKELHRLSSHLQ